MLNHTKKHYFALSSIKFNFLFSLFMLIAYNFLFIKKLHAIDPSIFFISGATLCVLMIFNACCTILFTKHTTKPLSILFCFLNTFVFYFMITYNTPVDKIMLLNVLQTDVYEVQDLLSLRMLGFIFVLAIVPSFIIYKTQIIFTNLKNEVKTKSLYFVLSLAICGSIMLANLKTTDNFFRDHRDAKYVLTPVNYISASLSVYKMRKNSDHPFVNIAEDAKLEKYWQNNKKNLFVFVVGETARAANFSLRGYNRPTNAPLDKHQKELLYFQDFSACGTSTAVALPCMFSKDSRTEYKLGSEEYTENFLDVLEKTGYKVIWRDNNTGCKNNCDRVEIEEFCNKKSCFDDVLLTNFKEKVKKTNQDTFVVMHQTGSHGPAYFAHYPKTAEIYKPTCQTEVLSSCSHEELINVYNNTVYYTSIFLSDVIEQLKALSDEYNTVLFYASDHGESLGENGIYLHAQPYDNAPKVQKDIPFMVWMSDETAQAFNLNRQCLQNKLKQPHSHDNLFHSVLGLSGVETKDYNPQLDIFNNCHLKP